MFYGVESSIDFVFAKMSTTMTITKSQPRPAQAGVMDHSIYPPIERFQTIDGLLRSHAAEEEQKSAICYPVKAAADFEEHTPAEVDRYTNVAAQYYIDQGLYPAVSIIMRQFINKPTDMTSTGSDAGQSTRRRFTSRFKLRDDSHISCS